MTSSFKFQIPVFSVISKKAQDAHVFKDLQSESLTYRGQLCDYGCTDILDKKRIQFFKGTNLFLSGKINKRDGF